MIRELRIELAGQFRDGFRKVQYNHYSTVQYSIAQ